MGNSIMKNSNQLDAAGSAIPSKSEWRNVAKPLAGLTAPVLATVVAIGIAASSLSTLHAAPQATEGAADVDATQGTQQKKSTAKVVGLKYNCVHVLKLEKTLKLYREILGFKMAAAEVLHGDGIEGMLVMKLQANDCFVYLSLTAPEYEDTIGLIGNTNHNHFMLLVNDIVPICDKLKEEGYALENEAYARDKYSFFTGPNGEVIGLTEHR